MEKIVVKSRNQLSEIRQERGKDFSNLIFDGVDVRSLGFDLDTSLENSEFRDCIFRGDIDSVKFIDVMIHDSCQFKSPSFAGCEVDLDFFEKIYSVNPEFIKHITLLPKKSDNYQDRAFLGREISNIQIKSCSLKNFSNKRLENVKFQSCDLSKADFSGSYLYDVEIHMNTHIDGADFSGAYIHRCIFNKCIGNGAIFGTWDGSKTYIMYTEFQNGVQFNETKFINCSFMEVKFWLVSLIRADFRKSDLRNCFFYERTTEKNFSTNLEAADLSNIDIIDCDLRGADSLSAKSLQGTNLLGTTLPEYLGGFEKPIQVFEEAAKSTRNLFIILVPLCFYILSMLFLTNEEIKLKLPFSDIDKINKIHFLAGSSLTVASLYVYFHIYLQKMWDQLKFLPAIFPDGAPVTDRIFPWIFGILAWDKMKLLAQHAPPVNKWMQQIICYLFGWALPLATLFLSYVEVSEHNIHNLFSEYLRVDIVILLSFLVCLLLGVLFHGNFKKSFI